MHVPGKESVGWKVDSLEDLPARPLADFDLKTLDGKWYKVMGLDSRYDCFDCQKNTFKVKDKNTLKMEALFRIPRPTEPGYLQNRIEEELHSVKPGEGHIAQLQSKGEMFGLTFWENWYVLADSSQLPSAVEKKIDMKLVYYTGHTLQGNYKGEWCLSTLPLSTTMSLTLYDSGCCCRGISLFEIERHDSGADQRRCRRDSTGGTGPQRVLRHPQYVLR